MPDRRPLGGHPGISAGKKPLSRALYYMDGGGLYLAQIWTNTHLSQKLSECSLAFQPKLKVF